jgi:hypothetical protein
LNRAGNLRPPADLDSRSARVLRPHRRPGVHAHAPRRGQGFAVHGQRGHAPSERQARSLSTRTNHGMDRNAGKSQSLIRFASMISREARTHRRRPPPPPLSPPPLSSGVRISARARKHQRRARTHTNPRALGHRAPEVAFVLVLTAAAAVVPSQQGGAAAAAAAACSDNIMIRPEQQIHGKVGESQSPMPIHP